MGRPAVEASLAPPRAAERRELSGKFRSHGFNSVETRKLWPDRELDPCLCATGPKNLPLGCKIAVFKMANKTLRARQKTSPELPRRGRDHEAKIRGRSEARGAFVHSLVIKWLSGKSVPTLFAVAGSNPDQCRKSKAQNNARPSKIVSQKQSVVKKRVREDKNGQRIPDFGKNSPGPAENRRKQHLPESANRSQKQGHFCRKGGVCALTDNKIAER